MAKPPVTRRALEILRSRKARRRLRLLAAGRRRSNPKGLSRTMRTARPRSSRSLRVAERKRETRLLLDPPLLLASSREPVSVFGLYSVWLD